MAEQGAISVWRTRAIRGLAAARRAGHDSEAQHLLEELRELHVELGERNVGTRSEQTTYLLARGSRTPLPELLAVGVDTNLWPLPSSTSPSGTEPVPASPDTERRITDLFQASDPLDNRPPRGPRYVAEHRPQDNQRFHEQPLEWAIWDTRTNLPIAYHPDKELCEYQADLASVRFENSGLP
ncbi:hypothetical protein ABZ905_32320 [Streptomyces parvus]|uniref:hypothetical protein n=1 Tax=Streptomyces parvus TaxID=66428 RepID=UPI0033DAD06E